jgi:hypothetical protein
MVPMPIGKAQSFSDILLGNSLCVSGYLFMIGIGMIFFARAKELDDTGRKLLFLNSLSLLFIAVISIIYFFPLPAACTGIAGLIGIFVGATKRNS